MLFIFLHHEDSLCPALVQIIVKANACIILDEPSLSNGTKVMKIRNTQGQHTNTRAYKITIKAGY